MEFDKRYLAHLKRLQEMKPCVENGAPAVVAKQGNSSRAWEKSRSHKERNQKIEHENIIIVKRLQEIMSKPVHIPEPEYFRLVNPYIEHREKEQKLIEKENAAIVKRVMEIKKKSIYDRQEQLQDYQGTHMAFNKPKLQFKKQQEAQRKASAAAVKQHHAKAKSAPVSAGQH